MVFDHYLNIVSLQSKLPKDKIHIFGFREHGKASDKYVDVIFTYPKEKRIVKTSIPYEYRHGGIFIDDVSELADFIKSIYPLYENNNDREWAKKEKDKWSKEHASKDVTKDFFDKMVNLKWNSYKPDLPENSNPARRIQDIKQMGYLIATKSEKVNASDKRPSLHVLLIPRDPGAQTGYESWSPSLRKRIIKVLGGYNAYEAKKIGSIKSLIPDHKFPETRWDDQTRSENPDDMSDEEIKNKFQLLDNQRNQQKREVCRTCFQTGKRGKIYGINYYNEGDENFPEDLPKTGKESEKGCVGCPWYDLNAWRESLNKKS